MGLPRIQYNNINIDFDRHLNKFTPPHRESVIGQNTSGSGIRETDFHYTEEFLQAEQKSVKSNIVCQLEKFYEYVKDGSSFKFWFDRLFGMYLRFEGESLESTDELSPTFARSGVANRTNPNTGYIEEIAASAARFESGKYGHGLLIEGAVTNLISNPENFSHADWTASNITVSTNTAEIKDPEGNNIADKLTATSNNGTLTQTTATAISTNSGVFSIYLAAQEPVTVTIYLMDSTGATLASESCSVGIEFARFYVRYVSSGTNANNWRVQIKLTTSGDIVYAFGGQLEVGASKSYPTSYINGTRNAESLYYAVTSDNQIAQLTGTISLWFKPTWNYYELPDGNCPVRQFIHVVDGTGNEVFELYRSEYQQIHFKVYAPDGSTTIDYARAIYDEPTVPWNDSDWNHLVVIYDLTTAGTFRLFLNGTLLTWTDELDAGGYVTLDAYGYPVIVAANDGNSVMLPRIPAKIYIGSTDTPDEHLEAIIDDVLFYKEIKTADWVSKIYVANRSFNWLKNYWSALELDDPNFNPVLKVGGDRYDFSLKAREVIT